MKRNFAFWLIILILLLALFSAFKGPTGQDARRDISYSEFLAGVEGGSITNVTIQENNIAGQTTDGSTFQTYAPNDATLIDKLNAKRMNDECTHSGRRESYKYAPTSRMTNTYIDNGESTFEEIIAATKYGLYAKKMGGGSVQPATGDFNFSVMEGYIVRDGKICEPVRGAALVGSGKDALLKIDMVGNNLLRAQGMCGSASGSIPTDVGQPTIRISEITVGGRKGAN